MQAREKILDDVARFAGGAVNALSGLSRQVKSEIRTRVDELATKLDLVPREDFERLEALIVKAREEQTRIESRLALLEKKMKEAIKKPLQRN